MSPLVVAAILTALVALSTVAGLLWRSSQGRVAVAQDASVDIPTREIPGLDSDRITLVQFSSPICAACIPTREMLTDIARSTDAVSHIEFDVVEHPELAARLGILQTPTTLLVDPDGRIRSRIGGAPRRTELVAALDRVAAESGLVGSEELAA